jgi:membrane protease subunit HflC
MQTQIQREAAEIRAGGNQNAQTIRAKADREVTVTVAEAQSRGEQIRGEGDATRNKIYADAYNQDRDFFSFYRSMQAYEQVMKKGDTSLFITPDSDFMRYFNDAAGKTPPAAR